MGDFAQLREHWDEAPFVTTGNGDLSSVFGVDVVEQFIHNPRLPVPAIRLIKSGVSMPGHVYARSREHEQGLGTAFVDGASVEGAIAAGYTLVIDDLKNYCGPIADLAREVGAETGFSVECRAFVTPAGSRGIPPHYDLVHGLIRQVHGSKRWRVYEPAEPFPTRPWEAARHRETRMVLDVVLRPGDCLYVPRGWVHVGDATDEASIHFTLGLKAKPWAYVLSTLFDEVVQAEEYRESLPYAFHRLTEEERRKLLVHQAESAAARLIELSGDDGGSRVLTDQPAAAVGDAPGNGTLLLALSRQSRSA